ncbi:MAG: hypothetical protein WBE13_09245 [Candidatus Acidiferrum sp.]
MKKALFLLSIVVISATLVFPRLKLHLIRKDGGGGVLLWRDDEVYLFMFDRLFGYYMSGADLLAEPINNYLHSPTIPRNDSHGLTIIHITPSTVERYVQKSTIGIDSISPVGDGIYATCPGGICKWSGVRFELISGEEEQKIRGRNQLLNDWREFTGIDGWSRRSIQAVGPAGIPVHRQYSIDVSEQLVLLVTEGNPSSVYLQRPNHPKELLWYYKQGLSLVGKAKFDSVFVANAK